MDGKPQKLDTWKRNNPDVVRGKEKERRERLARALVSIQELLPTTYLEECIANIKVGTPNVQKNIKKEIKTWKIPNYLICEMAIKYIQEVTKEVHRAKQIKYQNCSSQTNLTHNDKGVQAEPRAVSALTQTDMKPKNVQCQTVTFDSPSKVSKQFHINHIISQPERCLPPKMPFDASLMVARPWDMDMNKSPIKAVKKKLFSPAAEMGETIGNTSTVNRPGKTPRPTREERRKREASCWTDLPVSHLPSKFPKAFDSSFSINSLTNHHHPLNELPPSLDTNYFSSSDKTQQQRKHQTAPPFTQASAQSFSMGDAPLDTLGWCNGISDWTQTNPNWDPSFLYGHSLFDYNEPSTIPMHPNTSTIPHNISHILNN